MQKIIRQRNEIVFSSQPDFDRQYERLCLNQCSLMEKKEAEATFWMRRIVTQKNDEPATIRDVDDKMLGSGHPSLLNELKVHFLTNARLILIFKGFRGLF